ncbi:subtilase family serine protease [Silvibacterium bohemicum]|uniref:Subtilase family serine protease n=1 Tax=Silvibacterium bohemicum TaxID=1577686 RepID=A0A841JM12_9BACT|nr:protease pro-enzyme activation domain-containing protein [Silvibacterium bohemicum]MBB6142386.1 subtilase family serine protease [Silvibacterium bohemicum]
MAFAFFLSIYASSAAFAQSLVKDRIIEAPNSSATMQLPNSVNPRAKAQYDIGRVNASTQFEGITMFFKPSAEQQAALDALVQAQQTPGSPLFRQWITPAQYASQFGLSTSDLAKVRTWLEQQGFNVVRISNSRNAITFSGTAAQVEAAFQAQLHRYNVNDVVHTANAGALSIPAALGSVVLSVRNIADFRPHSLHRIQHVSAVNSNYNFGSGSSAQHFLAPGDFATIYDLAPLYNAGFTGSGKTIVIVGQSAIATADVTHFQSAAGLAQKTPTITLVPESGTSTPVAGDEDESDLDVEWSGAVATGATINFVYVGNNQDFSVFDSIQYAIDNNLGQVISSSYGACEADISGSDIATFQSWFEQANAQGQTVVNAAGDNGATDCESSGTKSTVVNGDEATQGLAVDYPGSSPNVTSIGGTEFSGDVNSPGTYWNSSNSSSNTSAIEYIPEMVWNDTSTTNGPDAGGGGKSILFGKPSWQTGIGVPNDSARDVPDVSLNASPDHDGYLFCASGTGGANADPNSCSNGFLDGTATSSIPTVAGGTSFGAPTFSGILAILNQKLNANGLGNVNPEIYSLAASDYASAFHDVTTGNNEIPCEIGSVDCTSSPIGYTATTGYDLASGWGSVDAGNFVGVFSIGGGASPVATTTVLTATSTSVTIGTAITVTATVQDNSGSGTPAGTIQFSVNGTNVGSAVTLSSGVATYSFTPSTAGTYTVGATYVPSDAATNSGSTASLAITVAATSNGSASFSLSATNVSAAQGSSGTSTVTVTPAGGFTGGVAFTLSGPSTLTNFSYCVNSATVSGTAAATATITLYTTPSSCPTAATRAFSTPVQVGGPASGRGHNELTRAMAGTAFVSLFLLGFPAFRRRRWPMLAALLMLGLCTLGVSGCGGSSSTTTAATTSPKGTYTLTLTGANSTLNLAETTSFTLTVN